MHGRLHLSWQTYRPHTYAYGAAHTTGIQPHTHTCGAQDLVQHWATKFDWRKQEAHLNRFPQFKLPVNGIDLHFVHLRSADPDAVPLVLSHGWPGSFFGARRWFLTGCDVLARRSCSTAHGGAAPQLPCHGHGCRPLGRSTCMRTLLVPGVNLPAMPPAARSAWHSMAPALL